MYSYADTLRVGELYIKLGKRLNATIRQVGYPTKNALRGWYREYVQPRSWSFRLYNVGGETPSRSATC